MSKRELSQELERQICARQAEELRQKRIDRAGATGLQFVESTADVLCRHGKHYFCLQCQRQMPKSRMTKVSAKTWIAK